MNSKFLPFSSIISPGFWAKFSEIVLEKQDVTKLPIWGYYGPSSSNVSLSILSVDHASFDSSPSSYHNQVAVKGELILTRSLQEFKNIDKNALIAEQFNLNNVEDTPQTLASFFILTHADLKGYVFTYWFGFPATSSIKISYSAPQPVTPEICSILESSKLIWDSGFFKLNGNELNNLNEGEDGIYGYLDPSTVAEIPGWVVRNYVAYIVKKRNLKSGAEIKLLSVRPYKKEFNRSCTFIFTIEFPPDWESSPKVLGWERNGDKISPKVVDLKSNLDPITLAESFVDFNLKLMKWRLFPEFKLEKMHQLKVCIIGSGTLGCNVARGLMGWGVRHMDLVDSGKVSYSNPVRQSLYNYNDSGKPKAATAAENLKSIFPGIHATGHDIHIPMPGHPTSLSTIEKIKKDFAALEDLIKVNDVIFLLTDTRESRWAPSVLGAAHNKLIINAALGFDSYAVMRHGRDGEDLGCYFCTDVVAPGDSTQDRTLDQQCTVTRPGVSMIAGALAVELMTSTLHANEVGDGSEGTLGVPAHSLRGWLSSGQQISPRFQRFDKCSACSNRVINAFKSEGIDFIVKAMDDPTYLEKLSGLDELKDGLDGIVELDDYESE